MVTLEVLERRLRKLLPYTFGPRELSRQVPASHWSDLCRMLEQLVDAGRLRYRPETSHGCTIPRFAWPEVMQ